MKTLRESLVIVTIATIMALLVNWKFHPTPLPWVHENRQVESASNSLLDSMMTAPQSSTTALTQTTPSTTIPSATSVHIDTSKTGSKKVTPANDAPSNVSSVPVKPTKDSGRPATKNDQTTKAAEKETAASNVKLPIAVNYDQVIKLLANPANVTFIDARKHEEHEKGSIQGSINIDILQFNESPQYRDQCMRTLYSIPKDRVVVSYCGGGNCELSHELCDVLIPMGFKRVLIYLGGWTEFTEKQGIKK